MHMYDVFVKGFFVLSKWLATYTFDHLGREVYADVLLHVCVRVYLQLCVVRMCVYVL